MNTVKTALLLGLLSGLLLLAVKRSPAGRASTWALGIAAVMNFASYFFSDKIALMTYNAQPVTPEQNPRSLPARRAHRARPHASAWACPCRSCGCIPDPSPNAFATGRNPSHASVAFTEGILQLMNDNEIEGVVAHELGHVLHRDILISSVAAMIAAAITFLARMAFWFGGGGDRR